jgi:DNA-binding LacI/PurR family transcriptional regulator
MSVIVSDESQVQKSRVVTMRDVARHVGVTTMTVSRALNGTGRIAESTKLAVRQAMEELGYEPNLNAQRLAGGRDERTVALMVPKLDFDVTLRKMTALQELLAERGYSVPLHAFGPLTSPKTDEHFQLAHELRRQKPRAIVCKLGTLPPSAQQEIRAYQQEGGTVISFNEGTDLECDQVLFDREDNNYQSARYLLSLGHRDIGFWSTSTYNQSKIASDRLNGFRRALREFGVAERDEWVMQAGNHTCNEKSGAELAQSLLAMKHRPTALCIVNDSASQACIAGLMRGGIRVPQDISIVSHDDLPIAQYGTVPLTVVSHPIREMAEAIVKLLVDRLENNSDAPPRCVTLKGELRVRDSTAPPKLSRKKYS